MSKVIDNILFTALAASVLFGFGVLVYVGLSEVTKQRSPSQLDRIEKKLDEVHRVVCGAKQ